MNRNTSIIATVVVIIFLNLISTSIAEDLAISDFLRLQSDTKTSEPGALESSIVSVQGKSDSAGVFSVDLVAAVHIADENYFSELNKRFKSYDQVLYELVARPEDLKYLDKKHDDKDSSTVSLLQKTMADYLDLTFQLKQIDYSAANFVHADMSPEILNQDMKNRGESFYSIFLKALASSAEFQDQRAPADLSDLFLLLTGSHSSTGLKRIVARQFADMDKLIEALNGKNGNSIIHGRNQVVIDRLNQGLEKGIKKYAVFYGAAHMPDLYRKLRVNFNADVKKTTWLKAWDLTLAKK